MIVLLGIGQELQRMNELLERRAPRTNLGETLAQSASRNVARLREDTEQAAARADALDNDLRN